MERQNTLRTLHASEGEKPWQGHHDGTLGDDGASCDHALPDIYQPRFSEELIDELEKRTGRKIIGNKSASGTEILDELAEEEIREGHLIVYTSADSVLQICGNEEIMGLDNLYHYCEIARN